MIGFVHEHPIDRSIVFLDKVSLFLLEIKFLVVLYKASSFSFYAQSYFESARGIYRSLKTNEIQSGFCSLLSNI